MRNMKKWLAAALALVMVFAMAACAVAEDTYTITINNTEAGHTYQAYQIFTGDLSGKTLSNIDWGTGITADGQTVLQNKYDTAETKSAAGVAATLKTEADAKAFAKEVAPYLTTAAATANTVTDGKYVISGLNAGYYLVKDKDDSQANANDAYTAFILEVVKNAEVTPKTGVPEVQKKVKDTNDSTGTTSDWQDSADYDIGDTIPYQLTATMGDLSHFDHYYVEFVDTMTHLTYTGITSVKVGDKTLSADDYSVAWNADTNTLTVSILDVKKYNAAKGTKVVVEYTATLDVNAVLGSTGNPNEVYLKFTNNPNNTGDGTNKPTETGETPKDKNIVFTYKVTANKVTSDKTPLAGAAFELFKKNADETYKSLGVVGATKNEDGTYTVAENITTFEWTGIDDGEYKIVEVVTPAGYNSISDILFTVTADHEVLSDNPTLKSLDGGDTFTGAVDTGTLSADIVNLAGTELPSTGGMGTTVLYVGGGMLVLAAVVLLIAKRRSNA